MQIETVKETYRKLNPVLKAQWLKALRSGKYAQAQGALYKGGTHGGYCCLGVLCDVKGRLDKSNLKGINLRIDIKSKEKMPKINGNTLISSSSHWIPTWVDRKAQSVLAVMNDKGDDFKTIAKWIAKNL